MTNQEIIFSVHQNALEAAALGRRYLGNYAEAWDTYEQDVQFMLPQRSGHLPIRGREPELDEWIEREYEDRGWGDERIDIDMILAYI